MSVVSDSEVFVTFVTPDIEGSARNMSEWNKIKWRWKKEKELKGRKKNYVRHIFNRIFHGNIGIFFCTLDKFIIVRFRETVQMKQVSNRKCNTILASNI